MDAVAAGMKVSVVTLLVIEESVTLLVSVSLLPLVNLTHLPIWVSAPPRTMLLSTRVVVLPLAVAEDTYAAPKVRPICCLNCSRVLPCIAGIVVPHNYQFSDDELEPLEQPFLQEDEQEPQPFFP